MLPSNKDSKLCSQFTYFFKLVNKTTSVNSGKSQWFPRSTRRSTWTISTPTRTDVNELCLKMTKTRCTDTGPASAVRRNNLRHSRMQPCRHSSRYLNSEKSWFIREKDVKTFCVDSANDNHASDFPQIYFELLSISTKCFFYKKSHFF